MNTRLPSTRSRFSRYRIPTFALALAIQVAVGVTSVLGIASLRSSNAWTEHTHQVINHIEVTSGAIRATESSARAYRLSGHPDYRSQYLASTLEVADAADRLVTLTRDNPVQDARARALRDLATSHLAELRRLFDLQELRSAAAAQAETDAQLTLEQWNAIAALSRDMRSDELRLLAERRHSSDAHDTRLVAIVVLGSMFSAALMAALMWNVVRENRRVRALERATRQTSREMADTMARIDRLSGQRQVLSRYSGLLQSCETRDEIMHLTSDTIRELAPEASGRCYLFRASQDFHESAATFGHATVSSRDTLLPGECWALRRSQPHLRIGGRGGPRCDHIDDELPVDAVSTLCIPLSAQGNALGLLHVSTPKGHEQEGVAVLFEQIAEQLGLAVANLQLRESLRTQSLRDPLTGLFNRRYLEASLTRELHRCERHGLPLSVLMLDIDHFKRFNDSQGHAGGDVLLSLVGRLLQSGVRADDIACRYGGEEFTVVMPELDAAGAVLRAEQIRRSIGMATVQHAGQTLGPVTVSIGIATSPGDGHAPDVLLQVADAMLYRAKAEGRDRVLHASPGA